MNRLNNRLLGTLLGLVCLAATALPPGPALAFHAESTDGPYASPAAPMHLAFEDTFSGGGLDPSRWTTCYPWFPPRGCTNEGNRELEWYLPSQVQVDRHVLSLNAVRLPITVAVHPGRIRTFPFRSGMVTTAGRFQFTYGVVQVVARVPAGRGYWPALWLLPADRSWPPEIDIMEALGSSPDRVALTYHESLSAVHRHVAQVSDATIGWHTFSVDWEPSSITWFVDGRQCFRVAAAPPHQPMYLLLDLAVDGRPAHAPNAATPVSGAFLISSVRIWTR